MSDAAATTTEIATRPAEKKPTMDLGDSGLVLRTLDDAWRFAQAVIKSGMAPKGYTTESAVIIALQHGAEIGLKPMQALHSIAVINGRATVWGDAIPGLLWGSGLLEDLREEIAGTGDDMAAGCEMRRKGAETPILRTFSVRDAKAAGLWDKAGPWKQYPKRMLAMRARSWAARDGFADVLRGIHVREEVMDYTPAAAPEAPRKALSLVDGSVGRVTDEPPAVTHDVQDEVIDVEHEDAAEPAGQLF